LTIKKYFTALFLLIACYSGTSQKVDNNLQGKTITARFNFLGIMDYYDVNFSIGAEYGLKPNWSIGSDLAYVYQSAYLYESKNSKGFIFRPFIRFYPGKDKRGFLEAELHYKYVSYKLTDWIARDVTNGVPAYEEYTTFHFRKNVFGVSIKTGTQANLSRNKKFRLELYIGLGIRFKNQGADVGTYIRGRGFFFDLYQPHYSAVVVPSGARFLYDIW
jgi:hypothetical protein